jgi:hypothetical protein
MARFAVTVLFPTPPNTRVATVTSERQTAYIELKESGGKTFATRYSYDFRYTRNATSVLIIRELFSVLKWRNVDIHMLYPIGNGAYFLEYRV